MHFLHCYQKQDAIYCRTAKQTGFMKEFVFPLIISSIWLCSCNTTKKESYIIISGNVKNIPAKKVYLTESHEWEKFLDSAEYKNDTFSFKIWPNADFIPFNANISFIDTITKKTKIFHYENYILSSKSQKYFYGAFYLDKGLTKINGFYSENHDGISISPNRQTDAMYETQMMSFGYVEQEDKGKRAVSIRKYKKLINKHPSSYYFLGEILNNRELYSSDELNEYLNMFTSDLQESFLGESLKKYIITRPNFDAGLANLVLITEGGSKYPITDTAAKLNMLVFWASWCAPCRAEIPELKKIHSKFRDRGLNISSISIDEDKQRWLKALEKEKMPWRQFIVDSLDIPDIKYRFDFSSIPFLVILDKKGVPLLRSVGFDPKRTLEQRSIYLDSLLKHQ